MFVLQWFLASSTAVHQVDEEVDRAWKRMLHPQSPVLAISPDTYCQMPDLTYTWFTTLSNSPTRTESYGYGFLDFWEYFNFG